MKDIKILGYLSVAERNARIAYRCLFLVGAVKDVLFKDK